MVKKIYLRVYTCTCTRTCSYKSTFSETNPSPLELKRAFFIQASKHALNQFCDIIYKICFILGIKTLFMHACTVLPTRVPLADMQYTVITIQSWTGQACKSTSHVRVYSITSDVKTNICFTTTIYLLLSAYLALYHDRIKLQRHRLCIIAVNT